MKSKSKTGKPIALIVALMLVVVATAVFYRFGFNLSTAELPDIQLPPGFKIEVYADSIGTSYLSSPGPNSGPRMMLVKDNVLFASVPSEGKIVAIKDGNADKKADRTDTFIEGLNRPHGIDFFDGWFYIAEENRVARVREKGGVADMNTLQVLVDDLPTGGHFTRTIKIHNNSLFLSVGSSCNVCIESDERRAAITACNLDGTNCRTFARGLRNAVGFVFQDGRMYATENGRDWLGDNAPPDEINLVAEGGNYGWPICYGKNIHDTDFDKNVYIRNPCMEPFEAESFVDLQAHSAPLGLAFYNGDIFPEKYRGDLFAAYHGSWNRDEPTGYKIVSIDMKSLAVEDFAAGWLRGNTVLGRPVDIIVWDGDMYVSDDNAGRIYRIFYEG